MLLTNWQTNQHNRKHNFLCHRGNNQWLTACSLPRTLACESRKTPCCTLEIETEIEMIDRVPMRDELFVLKIFKNYVNKRRCEGWKSCHKCVLRQRLYRWRITKQSLRHNALCCTLWDSATWWSSTLSWCFFSNKNHITIAPEYKDLTMTQMLLFLCSHRNNSSVAFNDIFYFTSWKCYSIQ